MDQPDKEFQEGCPRQREQHMKRPRGELREYRGGERAAALLSERRVGAVGLGPGP